MHHAPQHFHRYLEREREREGGEKIIKEKEKVKKS